MIINNIDNVVNEINKNYFFLLIFGKELDRKCEDLWFVYNSIILFIIVLLMVKVFINVIRIVKYNGLWCIYLVFWILVIYDIIWICIIYGGLGILLMIKWYY